jgi:hypothetical protein
MNDMPMLAEPMTIDMAAGFAQMSGFGNLPAVQPIGNQTAINTYGGVITAQRVAVPRDLGRLMQRLKMLANLRGESYVYSWEQNDNAKRRKVTIEGPTVKLANDLAREYGNCIIRVRVEDTATHWIITPQFVDLETGYGYERPFQQRKSQDTGMKDGDRAADLIFQIGVSKAIRNVIVNVLSTFVDFMVEESRNGLMSRFSDDAAKDKAHQFIDRVMERFEIAETQVAAVVGRARDKWTVKDLVRVYTEMRGIAEGMTVASEVYPSKEDAKVVSDEKAKKNAKPKAEPEQKPAETAKPPIDQAQATAAKQEAQPVAAAAGNDMPDIPENLRRPQPAKPAAQDDAESLFGKEG